MKNPNSKSVVEAHNKDILGNIHLHAITSTEETFKKDVDAILPNLFLAELEDADVDVFFVASPRLVPWTKAWRRRDYAMLHEYTRERIPQLLKYPIQEAHVYEGHDTSHRRVITFIFNYEKPVILTTRTDVFRRPDGTIDTVRTLTDNPECCELYSQASIEITYKERPYYLYSYYGAPVETIHYVNHHPH